MSPLAKARSPPPTKGLAATFGGRLLEEQLCDMETSIRRLCHCLAHRFRECACARSLHTHTHHMNVCVSCNVPQVRRERARTHARSHPQRSAVQHSTAHMYACLCHAPAHRHVARTHTHACMHSPAVLRAHVCVRGGGRTAGGQGGSHTHGVVSTCTLTCAHARTHASHRSEAEVGLSTPGKSSPKYSLYTSDSI